MKKGQHVSVPAVLLDEAVETLREARDKLEFAGKLGCQEVADKAGSLVRKIEEARKGKQ